MTEEEEGKGEIRDTRYEIREGEDSSFILHPSSFALFALLMTFLSMALQWSGTKGEAVIDDHGWLHDPATRGCSENAWDCFRHPQMMYYYRPLIGVSFVWSKRWFHNLPLHGRDEAFPFHVENLVQHGIAVLLVFWLLRLLFRRNLPAAIGGALFALHPLHVPVTTFIGGRPDTMALIFLALYAIGLLKMGQREKEKIRDTRYEIREGEETLPTINSQLSANSSFILHASSFAWLFLSLLAFTAAIFTKEQCLLMVLLAPLLVTLHQKQIAWERLWWLGVFAIPIAQFLKMARHVSQTEQMHDPTRTFFSHSLWSLPLHIQMIGRTCWYYAGAFLWPTVDHMHGSTLGPWDWAALGPLGQNLPPDLPTPPPIGVAVGGYAALGFTLWLLLRLWRNPACRFCLLWLLLTLLPCLNILPVPSQFVAPYRAAIPLFGVCGLLGAGFAYGFETWAAAWRLSAPFWKHIGPVLLLFTLSAVCIRFVVITRADIPEWRNDLQLMYAEMHADPNFTPARGGEAYVFAQAGEGEKALESYNKMLRQMVPEARTPAEITQAGRKSDWPRRAASGSSLRYNNIPYLANTLQARGSVYQMLGRWNEAAGDYRASQMLNPADHVIGDWLAYACDHAGLYGEAEAALKTQIAYAPDSYRLSQLGGLYYRLHRWAEARDTLQKSLRAPQSKTGARADLELAQRQYDEAFVRALPEPSNLK